jgi:hypothetical protein
MYSYKHPSIFIPGRISRLRRIQEYAAVTTCWKYVCNVIRRSDFITSGNFNAIGMPEYWEMPGNLTVTTISKYPFHKVTCIPGEQFPRQGKIFLTDGIPEGWLEGGREGCAEVETRLDRSGREIGHRFRKYL